MCFQVRVRSKVGALVLLQVVAPGARLDEKRKRPFCVRAFLVHLNVVFFFFSFFHPPHTPVHTRVCTGVCVELIIKRRGRKVDEVVIGGTVLTPLACFYE